MRIGKYRTHPAADILPLLGAPELSQLAKDIAQRGLLHPIVMCSGRVLDGRNRLLACRMAGVRPRFVEWDGAEPVGWVLATNVQRRHLSASQRAVVGLKALPLLEAEARERRMANLKKGAARPDSAQVRGREPGKASKAAASAVGTSARYIEAAKQLSKAAPKLLAEVKRGSLTLTQATRALRLEQRRTEVEHYKPPKGSYAVVVADPPWPRPNGASPLGEGEPPYPTMTVEEILRLKIPAADDCSLFLWAPACHLRNAFAALDAWGFKESNVLVWDKMQAAMGTGLRSQTEFCIVGVRGRPFIEPHTGAASLIRARSQTHSRKPTEFYKLVERVCPGVPRLELFARTTRPGWTCSGAELVALAG